MMYLLITYIAGDGGEVSILPTAFQPTYGDAAVMTVEAMKQYGAEYAIVARSADNGKTITPYVATMLAELPSEETVETAIEIARFMLMMHLTAAPPSDNWN